MSSGVKRAALPTRYEFALLYCAAIWGSTFYVVRDAVTQLHPLTLIGWRFTLAGALLLPLAIVGAKRSFARETVAAQDGRSFASPLRPIDVTHAAQ